jgi:hypothetical protein
MKMSKNDRIALIEDFRREFATKADLSRFATKEDLANVRGDLRTEITEVKSDVLRWMFAFFVTMLLAILGLYFKK